MTYLCTPSGAFYVYFLRAKINRNPQKYEFLFAFLKQMLSF